VTLGRAVVLGGHCLSDTEQSKWGIYLYILINNLHCDLSQSHLYIFWEVPSLYILLEKVLADIDSQ
jgi:hypothetical protein